MFSEEFERAVNEQLKPLRTRAYLNSGNRPIVVRWPIFGPVRHNWGDKLNPYLVRRLSGRRVLNAAQIHWKAPDEVYYFIGSSLGLARRETAVIFGTGFISKAAELNPAVSRVTAVRGPLSADKLRGRFGDLPLGDGALLLPLFYRPRVAKRYRVGLIAHYRERDLSVFTPGTDSAVKTIDICGGIEPFIDQVLSCETIVSSSLHGAIAAHAYGVPAALVTVSDRPTGDGFKLLDYLYSVGLGDRNVLHVTDRMPLLRAAEGATAPAVLPSIRRLLEACPFLMPELLPELVANIPKAYSWAIK